LALLEEVISRKLFRDGVSKVTKQVKSSALSIRKEQEMSPKDASKSGFELAMRQTR
jgi:hypothetical protein